jgi:hypothetical protein
MQTWRLGSLQHSWPIRRRVPQRSRWRPCIVILPVEKLIPRLLGLKREKEAKRMEWGKGIVQRDKKENARREMELERGKGFERCVAILVLNELD